MVCPPIPKGVNFGVKSVKYMYFLKKHSSSLFPGIDQTSQLYKNYVKHCKFREPNDRPRVF